MVGVGVVVGGVVGGAVGGSVVGGIVALTDRNLHKNPLRLG